MSAPDSKKHIYRLEVVSDSPFYAAQDLFVCIAAYDNGSEKPDVVYGSARPPVPGVPVVLETRKATDRITIAVYQVPNEYPDSREVADNPPYELEYKVYRDGELIEKQSLQVDRWGGVQVVGVPYK